MASTVALEGLGLPRFSDQMHPEDAAELKGFLYQFKEQVIYIANNLDSANMNEEMRGGLDDMTNRIFALETGGVQIQGLPSGANLQSIMTRLDAIEQRLSSLERTQSTYGSQISSLSREIGYCNSDVSSLNSKVSELESDLKYVAQQVGIII